MNDNKKEKKLLKNTLLYAFSNFGSKILVFLIVPLYTFYLTTAEYGTADTVVSLVNVLAPISVLSIHDGILRWLLKSDEEDSTIIWTGLKLYVSFAIVSGIVLGVITYVINWKYWLDFIFLLTSLSFQNVMQYISRGLKKNKIFAVSGIIYTIIMLSLNILLIVVLKWGVIGMLRSMSIAHFLSGLYIVVRTQSFYIRKYKLFDRELSRKMLTYSCLLVPNAISWWIMNTSDRIMLTVMIGASFTGIYSVACKFPSIMAVVHTLFYQAWQEQAVLEYDEESRDAYYTKIFNIYMKLSICVIIVLIPLTKVFINRFMNESYRSSYKYVSILYLGALFSSYSSFYGTGYISAKDPGNATLTTTIGASVNCLINLFFINHIGVWAACVSTLIGYLVVYIIRVFQTRKYFRIDIDLGFFSVLLLVASVFSIVVVFANTSVCLIMTFIAITLFVIVNKTILDRGFYFVKKRLANTIIKNDIK